MARGPAVALLGGIGGLGPLMFDGQTGSAPCIVSVSGAPSRYGVAFLAWQLL